MEEEADGNVGELEISTECGEQQHEMMVVHPDCETEWAGATANVTNTAGGRLRDDDFCETLVDGHIVLIERCAGVKECGLGRTRNCIVKTGPENVDHKESARVTGEIKVRRTWRQNSS